MMVDKSNITKSKYKFSPILAVQIVLFGAFFELQNFTQPPLTLIVVIFQGVSLLQLACLLYSFFSWRIIINNNTVEIKVLFFIRKILINDVIRITETKDQSIIKSIDIHTLTRKIRIWNIYKIPVCEISKEIAKRKLDKHSVMDNNYNK